MSLFKLGNLLLRGSLGAQRSLCIATSLPSVEQSEDDVQNDRKNKYDDLKYAVGKRDRIQAPVQTRAQVKTPVTKSSSDWEVPGMVDLKKKHQREIEDRQAHFNSEFSKKLLRLANYHHEVGEQSVHKLRHISSDECEDEDAVRSHYNQGPAYNHGLSGQGKRSNDRFQRQPQSALQGEVLFGLFPCLLALQTSRRAIYQVFVRPGFVSESDNGVKRELLQLAEDQDVRVRVRHKEALFDLSQSRPHQGVCMDVSPLKCVPLDFADLHSVESSQPQIWVVLDKVQDPMNFGAILRSCYYLGADRVVVSTTDSCATSPVVSKSSAGVLEILPVHGVTNMMNLLQEGQQAGWDVVGTAGQGATPLHRYSLSSNTLLVLGNEGLGLGDAMRRHCDHLLSIPSGRPLHPNIDSLNVSVATAIILSHLTAKRQ